MLASKPAWATWDPLLKTATKIGKKKKEPGRISGGFQVTLKRHFSIFSPYVKSLQISRVESSVPNGFPKPVTPSVLFGNECDLQPVLYLKCWYSIQCTELWHIAVHSQRLWCVRDSDFDAVFSVWGCSPHLTCVGPEEFETPFGISWYVFTIWASLNPTHKIFRNMKLFGHYVTHRVLGFRLLC